MADRGSSSVDTLVLARASAMVLMVANHSRLSQALIDLPALYGGLNAMLVVSGISMATHAFQQDTRSTLNAFLRFGLRLAIPALAVALVWDTIILILGARDITPFRYFAELTLFSNWLSTHKLALFPIWYVQAVVQLLAGLALLFLMTDLTARIRAAPMRTCGFLLLGSVAVALLSYSFWDTSRLEDRLPHLLLWNLVLGWFIWAVQRNLGWTVRSRLLLTATLLACAALLYLPTGASYGLSRAVWMPLIVLPVIWWKRVPLPRPLVHAVHLLAQAVFAIFLMHFYVFGLVEEPLLQLGIDQPVLIAGLKLVAGLIVPVLLWAAGTAFIRVWRHRRISRPVRPGP